jgi:hypothetical protein
MRESNFAEVESLLWTVLRNFESIALQQYQSYCPALATPEKRTYLTKLQAIAPDDALLEKSELSIPIRELLASAQSQTEVATLIIQGLILEQFGRALYDTLARLEEVGPQTRTLALEGKAISSALADVVPSLLTKKNGEGEVIFEIFVRHSHDVLRRLDILGEGLDQRFADRFSVRFSEIVAEFAADLIQTCVAMGINRKKLMCHLTGCLMGI